MDQNGRKEPALDGPDAGAWGFFGPGGANASSQCSREKDSDKDGAVEERVIPHSPSGGSSSAAGHTLAPERELRREAKKPLSPSEPYGAL